MNEMKEIGYPVVTITRVKSDRTATKQFKLSENRQLIEKLQAPSITSGLAETMQLPLHEIASGISENEVNTYGLFDLHKGATAKVAPAAFASEGQISLTKEHFFFMDKPGVLFLDNDPNDHALPSVPYLSGQALMELLESVVPECITTQSAFHSIPSASAGKLYNIVSPEPLYERQGTHLYLAVKNPTDIPRFGGVLGKRLWLAGYGSIAFARSGAMLERTVIDLTVFQPQRLDYIAPAVIIGDDLPPIEDRPNPVGRGGGLVETELLPDLTAEQEADYARLVREAKEKAKPQSEVIRADYKKSKVDEMVAAGVDRAQASRDVERSLERICTAISHCISTSWVGLRYPKSWQTWRNSTSRHWPTRMKGRITVERRRCSSLILIPRSHSSTQMRTVVADSFFMNRWVSMWFPQKTLAWLWSALGNRGIQAQFSSAPVI